MGVERIKLVIYFGEGKGQLFFPITSVQVHNISSSAPNDRSHYRIKPVHNKRRPLQWAAAFAAQ
jgi:hypothetical protein